MTLRTLMYITLFTAVISLAPHAIFAQEQTPAGFVPLSGTDFNSVFGVVSGPATAGDIGKFVENAFSVALSLGAILAVMRIAYAGYQYMTSDAWGEKSNAKEILGDVVIGILLLMSIWLILYQINPQMLTINLINIQGSGQPAQQTAPTTPSAPSSGSFVPYEPNRSTPFDAPTICPAGTQRDPMGTCT